jgi:hypothetical protein
MRYDSRASLGPLTAPWPTQPNMPSVIAVVPMPVSTNGQAARAARLALPVASANSKGALDTRALAAATAAVEDHLTSW